MNHILHVKNWHSIQTIPASCLKHAMIGVLLGALAWCAAAQSARPPKLGAPFVLASNESKLHIEIPIQLPQTQQTSSSQSYIRLASPSIHAQQGLNYPAWLGDASYAIKSRAQQRSTLLIEPKRGNPALATELILEWVQDGRAQQIPYTLLLDHVSAFAGAELPQQAAVVPSDTNTATAAAPEAVVVAPTWGQPSMATTPSTKPIAARTANYSQSSLRKPAAQTARKAASPVPVALAALAAPALPPPPPPPPPSPSPMPEKIASAPLAPVEALPQPTATPPLRPATAAVGLELSDWIFIGLGVLLLLVIASKLWLARKAQKAKKVPLLTQKTKIQDDAAAFTNTVFGVTDAEAHEMHLQWMQKKANNK